MNKREMNERVKNFREECKDLGFKLSSAIGKQVLVIVNREVSYGCGGRNSSIEKRMKLGILESPHKMELCQEVSLETKLKKLEIFEWIDSDKHTYYNLVLPMSKHVEISDGRYDSQKWQLKEEPIIVSPFTLFNLGTNAGYTIGESGCFSYARRISKPALIFEVGEDVETYFRFHNAHSRYNREIIQETAEFLKNRPDNDKWIDTSYVDALMLLGREDLIPFDFMKEKSPDRISMPH